jgi:GTP-binding protein LepA
LKLKQVPKKTIECGDVGYLVSGIKDAREVKVGDTITSFENLQQDRLMVLKK